MGIIHQLNNVIFYNNQSSLGKFNKFHCIIKYYWILKGKLIGTLINTKKKN